MLQGGTPSQRNKEQLSLQTSSCVVCHISVVFQKIVMLSVKPFCHSNFFPRGLLEVLLRFWIFFPFFFSFLFCLDFFLTVVCDSTTQGHKQILKDHFKLEQWQWNHLTNLENWTNNLSQAQQCPRIKSVVNSKNSEEPLWKLNFYYRRVLTPSFP